MSDSHATSPTFADVTRDVARTLAPPGNLYFGWMSVVALILTAGIVAWTGQIWWGMGMAGKRVPQMWAMYITSFVFWIGIGHAGTLISAILYLFRARWRTSIYRAAEAMTIFAVMTAGLFPLIHAGRMWFAYYLLPYPNQRDLWPNFRSPLVWDVFAISTYLSISTVFFIVGLVPDIAALRDVSSGWRRRIYAMLALGWEGADSQWRHYRRAYGLLASLATPLVLSVPSVGSWDFAIAADPLLEGGAHEPGRALRRVHPRLDRHVVRALQHHRPVPRARLLPVHVGHLLPEPDRHDDRHRQLRLVLPPVSRVHPGDAVALGRRGQGDAAAAHEGQGPWQPPLRRSWASSPTWTRRYARSRSSGRRATTTSPSTRPSRCTRSRRSSSVTVPSAGSVSSRCSAGSPGSSRPSC